MYHHPFFPNMIFGWAFCSVLFGILVVSAWVDLRTYVIPKWITIPMLGIGLVASIVRAAWVGAIDGDLWFFSSTGLWLGVADGVLTAVLGFLCGFTALFLMWMLGACGGGDVKLFAALGAWLGPVVVLATLAVSVVVLMILVPMKIIFLGFDPAVKASASTKKKKKPESPPERRKSKAAKFRLSYSLPVAIATALTMIWIYRGELHVAFPVDRTASGESSHAG